MSKRRRTKKSSRSSRKGKGLHRWLLPFFIGFCLFALGFTLGIYFRYETKISHTAYEPFKDESIEPPQVPKRVHDETRTFVIPVREERPKGYVAIIIDDIGYRKIDVERFSSIPFPIVLSVIPFTPFDRYSAEYAHAKGKSVMLHIPMEPNHTGEIIERLERRTKGMITTHMSLGSVRKMLVKELRRVPYAVGANNHMGSKFTRDERRMGVVISFLKDNGLFFVDSRTTSKSVACRVGKALGAVVLKRDIFLDNSKNGDYIKKQLDQLADKAFRRGYAIAIGHPHISTYRALVEKLPELEKKGVEVVPIEDIYAMVLEGRYEGCF